MSFENMKSALASNASMDKKSTIEVKSVSRTYRIRMDIAEALQNSDLNKNKFVNEAVEKALKEKGLL